MVADNIWVKRGTRVVHIAFILAFALIIAGVWSHRRAHAAEQVDPLAEIHCLALNIYHEGRGEDEAGWRAIAAVTFNRLRDERWPFDRSSNTICGIVKDGGEEPGCQFSWWCDGRSDRPRPEDRELFKEITFHAAIYWQAYRAGSLEDNTYGAHSYFAKDAKLSTVSRRYFSRFDCGITVGNHTFCRDSNEVAVAQ